MDQILEPVPSNWQSTAILKELGDIKVTIATNAIEVTNIKINIKEIKDDVKDIKNNFISRREFDELTKNFDTSKLAVRINSLENWRWYIIGIVTVIVFLVEIYSRMKN